MTTHLVSYCIGLLITSNLLCAWLYSNFPQHLWNVLHPGGQVVYTKDDLMLAASEKYGTFGDLWVCPICLGTWLSLFVAFVLWLCSPVSAWVIFVGPLTWPGLFYLFDKFVSKK